MSTISLTSFNAGEVIVSSTMNTNFDNINNWASTAALKAGAAFTGDVSITTGTFTVGANAAGDDVKFFGDTSGAYMEWDADTDDLILAGAARVVVPDGQLVLASTAVTSTAAELNILDGVTASTSEINILDGVTATAGELNILDGVTATTAEINYLDDDDLTAADLTKLAAITSSAAEINVLDGVTGGTVTASKALVVDSNKDIASLRNVTLTGTLTFDSVGITAVTTSAETFADNDTSLLTAGAVVHQFLQYSVEGGADAGATIYVKADAPYADGAGEGVKGDIWIDT